VEDDDFNNKDTTKPIDITICFYDLTTEEKELFNSNLIDEMLTVTRRLIYGGGKESGNYFVEALVNPAFLDCRNEQGKAERREKYKKLQDSMPI
jgi:hypothetical protein